jgi:eukaryotic-like serine/threonine-protein kinase
MLEERSGADPRGRATETRETQSAIAALSAALAGRYVIERALGRGGMATVYLARDLRHRRPVAIKVLAPDLSQSLGAERFLREIELAANLQHPHVVPLFDSGEAAGLLYYVMPFVQGESLRERLAREGQLGVQDVVQLAREVAGALDYAHEQGVVHRDIKPENVLLSRGHALVADFGVARALSASQSKNDDTLSQGGTLLGTPAYMSPEQTVGDPDVDHRADIYAFGCMAYELLVGRPPFHGRPLQRVLTAHLTELPQPIAELRGDTPPQLADLVMKCLAKEPGARPQSAAEVARVLDLVKTREDIHAIAPILVSPSLLRRALMVYTLSLFVVAALARASIAVIGLPDWVFPGALGVMALGLPVILFTGYVHRAAYRALRATPGSTRRGVDSQEDGVVARLAAKASPHVSWRRTTLGGAYALAAFVLLVAAFMTSRALGIGPAGSLQAAGKLRHRERLLIADFNANGVDPGIANAVSEAVRADLSQSAAITLVSPASVADALRRMQRPVSSRVDLTLARELAAREGARAIVHGTVTALGSGVLIGVRLVSADSGTELVSFRASAVELKDLIPAVDDLSRRLRGKIGESLRTIHESPPLEQVTTSSLDALRVYTAGARANDVESNFAKAVQLLREAVALDSAFAMAWRKLGTSAVNAGLPQSVADSALAKAFHLRDRLPAVERLLTEGAYFSPGPGRDRAKAITAFETLLSIGDTVPTANSLAIEYASRREFDRAESLFDAAIRLNPGSALAYFNIVVAQANGGKLAEAEASLARARDRFPGSVFLKPIELKLLYLRGEWRRYEALLDSLRHSRNLAHRSLALRSLAALAKTRGRISGFARFTSERRAADSARGFNIPPLVDSAAIFVNDAWLRDRPDPAVRRLDSTLAKSPILSLPDSEKPYLDIAIAYAVAGAPHTARAVLAQFQAELKDTALVRHLQPDLHRALAEIALAEKRPVDAAAEFRLADTRPDGPSSACSICLYAGLARAFDLATWPDSALAMYERYVETPYAFRPYDADPWVMEPAYRETSYTSRFTETDPGFLARTYLRLGELYEAKGERSKSVSYYARFVDLWKDADIELGPKIAYARAHLEKLRESEPR